MPYIDMHEHHEGFAMIESVRKNFEGFTRTQVENVVLAWDCPKHLNLKAEDLRMYEGRCGGVDREIMSSYF